MGILHGVSRAEHGEDSQAPNQSMEPRRNKPRAAHARALGALKQEESIAGCATELT